MLNVELIFWGAVAFVFYAYAGYPCALLVLAHVRSRPVVRAPIRPRVSFIIAAHNEERRIAGKIENTLRLEYPSNALDIIVASDASTDRTEAIVRAYAPRIWLVRSRERRGKEAAQQLAVRSAMGEILVFSDVATALPPQAINTIVQNFADPTVGCVSSLDRLVDEHGMVAGEGVYVRYEMWLRTLETRANTLVGLSGSFFAARRDVCRRWAADRQSDFSTLLNAVKSGYRGVLDPRSVGCYRNIADDRREFDRKVRTVARGIAVVADNLAMLNPFRYGLFAWQLASHKLCRWLVPFALVAAAVANALLASRSSFYGAAMIAQAGFYMAALMGLWVRSPLLKIPMFFVLGNLAVLRAWLRVARGERVVVWEPSDRHAVLPRVEPAGPGRASLADSPAAHR